jgi:hypothetical protein
LLKRYDLDWGGEDPFLSDEPLEQVRFTTLILDYAPGMLCCYCFLHNRVFEDQVVLEPCQENSALEWFISNLLFLM